MTLLNTKTLWNIPAVIVDVHNNGTQCLCLGREKKNLSQTPDNSPSMGRGQGPVKHTFCCDVAVPDSQGEPTNY